MIIPTTQIERWLQEDIGHHDVNNDVPGETSGRLVTKESGVGAGLDAAQQVFEYFDADVELIVSEGDRVEAGETVLRVAGPAAGILRAERVAVNIAGHCSGIATSTRHAVDAAHEIDENVDVAATRKTTPGLRGLEKRAVAVGGGDTHRLDLSHMVLVKENHIAELGLEGAIEHFDERTSFATKIEVEVEQPENGRRAAEAGADIILFDNLSPTETERGVTDLPGGVLSEASGGITLDNIQEYAATGVDIISMGALTHSSSTLDYSFRTD